MNFFSLLSRILLTLALLAGIVFATEARSLDDVRKSGFITIFVYKNYQPYSWEEDGQVLGADADIAREIARALDVELKFLIREADENVDDDLRINIWKGDLIQRKAADVMLHVPYDRELEIRAEARAVLFNPYFGEEIAVAYDTGKIPKLETFARFVRTPIAVELDTVSDFFLSNAFRGQLHQSIRRGRAFLDAVKTFETGDAPALMASKAQAEWVRYRNPEKKIEIAQPPMPGIVRGKWPIGMAVKEDSRDLGYAIADVIAELQNNGKMAEIFARYGVIYQKPDLE